MAPNDPTTSPDAKEALRIHNAGFKNCVEDPPGSGNFMLPFRKKLLYAWPSLGYYMMRYLRSGQMKKFYSDWLGVPMWWIAVVVAVAVMLALVARTVLVVVDARVENSSLMTTTSPLCEPMKTSVKVRVMYLSPSCALLAV